ncbi:MAG: hypothetical protein ABSH52_26490 [Terriglobia bacterium]|jgi:hypothetical protein
MNPVIPGPVPVPLPAPPGLLEFLLVFTLILHLLAMNFLLGGVIILTVSSYLGRRDSRHHELTGRVSRALPPVTAFTITLGVGPLLFLQLVYGQLFYTSSVLMAWYWLAVVLLVLLGYYGVYWLQLRYDALGPKAPWVMLATAVLFLLVAFIFTQNITAMQHPQDFYPRFMNGQVGKIFGPVPLLNLVRLAHFVVAAVALAGLGIALLSTRWRADSPELAAWARRYGVTWFMGGTLVQFLVGLWFLLSLPVEIRQALVGDRLAVGVLILGIMLALLALLTAPASLGTASVAILGTVCAMVVLRHLVRLAYLRPYFDPHSLPVRGQWVVFSIFGALLLAGLATVGWMLYVFYRPAAESHRVSV